MAQLSSSQSRNHVPCKVIVLGDGGIGKTCMLHSYTHQYQFLADSQQYIRTVFETYHALVDVDLSTDTDASKLQHRPTFMQLALWDTAGQENYDQLRSMAYKKTALRTGAAVAGNDSNPPTNPSGGVASESTVEVTTLIPTFVGTSVDVSVFILCFAWNDPASLTNVQAKWNREVLRVMADVKAERAASDASSSDGRGRDPKTKKHQPMLPLHAAAHGQGGSSSSTARPFVVILCGTKCDIKAAAAPNAPGIVTYEQVDQVMTHIGADAFVSCSAKTGEGVKDVLDTAMKRWFQRVMDDLPDHSPSQGFLASICSMM